MARAKIQDFTESEALNLIGSIVYRSSDETFLFVTGARLQTQHGRRMWIVHLADSYTGATVGEWGRKRFNQETEVIGRFLKGSATLQRLAAVRQGSSQSLTASPLT